MKKTTLFTVFLALFVFSVGVSSGKQLHITADNGDLELAKKILKNAPNPDERETFRGTVRLAAISQKNKRSANDTKSRNTEDDAEITKLGRKARDLFYEGWTTGNWEQFINLLDKENFTFQFPAGPFVGRHKGQKAVDLFLQFFKHHAEMNNKVLEKEIDFEMVKENWYVFTDHAKGTFYNKPYESRHAIFLKFENGKIIEFREYVGDITNWK